MPDLSPDVTSDTRPAEAKRLSGEAARRAAAQLAEARVTKERGVAGDAPASDCGALFWSWAAPDRHAGR